MVKRFKQWVNRSIQRRLIIWSIGFWVLSVSVLSLTFLLVGQTRAVHETYQRNTQLASVISRDINAKVSTIFSDTRTFSRHLEAVSPDLHNQAEALLALRLASPQRYRAAYYFDVQGNLLLHLTDTLENLLLLKDARDIVSRPPMRVPEQVAAIRQKVDSGTAISDVSFVGIERSPVLYVGVPAAFPGGEKRVAVLELDLRDIWQRIDLISIGQSGFAYVVSPDGTIIAHPDRAYVGQPIPAEIRPLLAGYEGFTEYSEPINKRAAIAAFSPVGGQTGWGIVLQQDKSEAYAAISRTAMLSIIIWLGLAIAGTISILVLIRNFTRPIAHLTRTAQAIAHTGDLTQTIVVQNPDEVGQLGEAFDQMIGRLSKSEAELQTAHNELELRVERRTADLRQANILLQQEISHRTEAEEKLRQSELKYRHLVQSANTIILEMDTKGRVTFINQFAEEFFGFKESEILGRSVIGTIVPPKDSSGKDLEAMIEDIVKNPERYRHNENENMRQNGEKVWLVWSNQPLYDEDGQLREILCIGIDRTEQKRAAEALAAQEREQAAAAERTRLARDLHDAVSQTLFSASLISEVLPRLWERNKAEGQRRLEEVRQLTRGALAEMRTLLFELRPAALADAELGDLLRHLAESITGRARVPVAVEVEGQCALTADVKVALYRIAQEALNNVAKHSGASQARVSLHCHPDRVELRVSDNGRGFDTSQVPADSLGIGIMGERARAIDACLNIESKVGQGTEVVAIWSSLK